MGHYGPINFYCVHQFLQGACIASAIKKVSQWFFSFCIMSMGNNHKKLPIKYTMEAIWLNSLNTQGEWHDMFLCLLECSSHCLWLSLQNPLLFLGSILGRAHNVHITFIVKWSVQFANSYLILNSSPHQVGDLQWRRVVLPLETSSTSLWQALSVLSALIRREMQPQPPSGLPTAQFPQCWLNTSLLLHLFTQDTPMLLWCLVPRLQTECLGRMQQSGSVWPAFQMIFDPQETTTCVCALLSGGWVGSLPVFSSFGQINNPIKQDTKLLFLQKSPKVISDSFRVGLG